MGLDVLLYNKSGEEKDFFEINENFHYWLFNIAGLNKSNFPEIFKIQDYYITDVQFTNGELQRFICELEIISRIYPNKYINSILNRLRQKDIVKIRITGD